MKKSLVMLAVMLSPALAANAAPPAKPVSAGGASEAACKKYCDHLWQKLNNNWLVPEGVNNVTVTAILEKDGTPGEINATSSPKSADGEGAALTAFEKSKPLDLLPAGMNSGRVTIKFTSKADPHGDSTSGGSVRLDPVN